MIQISPATPIQESWPDDTDITCNNHPCSPRKIVVTQTRITIEHLTYSTENLMNSQENEKIFVFVKSAPEQFTLYRCVTISGNT